jgi:uncharacterized protein YdaU (DUF1376 family)
MKTPDSLKRQDPAYRLYTADFLVRTQNMTNEQVGKYIRLLCYQHQNGHISEADMLSFCKGRDELVFSKFIQDEKGFYYNEEMENEIQRRAEVSKVKSQNARSRGDQDKKEQPPIKVDTFIPEYDG